MLIETVQKKIKIIRRKKHTIFCTHIVSITINEILVAGL